MKVKDLKKLLEKVDENANIILKIEYNDSGDEITEANEGFINDKGDEVVICGYKDDKDDFHHDVFDDDDDDECYGYNDSDEEYDDDYYDNDEEYDD